MTDARQRRFWHRTGPLPTNGAKADAKPKGVRYLTGSVLAFGAFLAAATNQGCGSGSTNMATEASSSSSGSSSSGNGGSTSSSSGSGGASCNMGPFGGQIAPGANGGFTDAFDATPNANGSAVFFTAVDMAGNPGVFKQDICAMGAPTAIYTGGVFEAPFGIAISTDDKTLFVVDPSAEEDPTNAAKDKGILFSLSAAGGMAPTPLVASVAPRGVTVVAENNVDQVYFTGIDKANQLPGVFKVAASGGAVTTIAEGAPFNDPGGVAVAANGDVYVVDTSGSGSSLGNIILVPKGGAAAEFVADLQVGFPAGLALMKDDSTILVSGLNPGATSDVVFEVTVASKAVSPKTFGTIDVFAEAAGLHRAHNMDVFAWADSKATPAGLMGTGTVFVIK